MYAAGTSVSVERSRAEIERLIRKHGGVVVRSPEGAQ
jgi:hypothetical protein